MRFPTLPLRGLTLLALFAAGACADGGSPIEIAATSELAGQVVVDLNGDRLPADASDVPAPDMKVSAVGTWGDTVASATTDANGRVLFSSLPVGTYQLVVSPSALGDTLRVVRTDSATVTVGATVTPTITFILGFPDTTANGASSLPAGRTVAVTGVALYPDNLYGDSTLAVVDSTGAIRVAQLTSRFGVAAGDTVRVIGRTGSYLGQPALLSPRISVVAHGPAPAPQTVSTATAATAASGTLDAALVQVKGANVITVVALSNGDRRVRVSGGSSYLDIVLDRNAGIDTEDPILPGAKLSAVGTLVPNGATGWRLLPRFSSDLTVTIPTATVAQARKLAIGSLVSINAVALNSLSTFGDNSLHLADATGAILSVNVPSTYVVAGDSVRAIGLVGAQDGQPVLGSPILMVLGKTDIPEPVLLSTATASTASGGKLDAALVEVRHATIDTVITAGSGVVLQVDDGSGVLSVYLSGSTGIGLASFAKGETLDIVGVLRPDAGGGWQLRPRSPVDIQKE